MLLCLFLQAVLVITALRYYTHHKSQIEDPSIWSSLLVVKMVMLILVVGNLAQVAIWGALFQWLGEFELFEEAFYHSMVNFATLGYGDHVMSDEHKHLGPLEAINGVLMIGVTTAMLLAAFNDSMRKTIKARREEPGD